MSKKLLSLFLMMLLLSTVFCGCVSKSENSTDSDTERTSTQIDTGSGQTDIAETIESQLETMNTENIYSDVTTEPETHEPSETEISIPWEEKTPVETSKPETKLTETNGSASSSEKTPSSPTLTTAKPEESKPAVITEPPKPVEPTIPPITTAEPPKPTEPYIPPEESVAPKFDIDYWINFAKEYAVSIDLNLSPTAVECWDNPIIAGSHCKYLERDITDCLSRYKNFEGFTGVWIWAEPDGKGSYKLYIGYE